MESCRAIVIVERSINPPMRFCDTSRKRTGSAYAFGSYGQALAFLQETRVDSVVIEFDVGTDTLDFCDAVKALKVPIVVSPYLEPGDLKRYGVREPGLSLRAGDVRKRTSSRQT